MNSTRVLSTGSDASCAHCGGNGAGALSTVWPGAGRWWRQLRETAPRRRRGPEIRRRPEPTAPDRPRRLHRLPRGAGGARRRDLRGGGGGQRRPPPAARSRRRARGEGSQRGADSRARPGARRASGEAARTSRQEVEEQLRVVEGRVERLEQGVGEARITAEAEMARLRNEVSLAVQELSQRIDERFQAMSQWCSQADESASGVIREAQVICVRLADDALGAAEASQLK